MIKINAAVIVEGKYDKIKLENIIDALIIPTDGFRIFKNAEKRNMIKLLAEKNGIVVITDSDSAGNLIRNHLKGFVPADKIINVYLPQVEGKESRKQKKSVEGFLGVEFTDDAVILKALSRAGVTGEKAEIVGRRLTKSDFYALGISGGDNSRILRENLLVFLGLPQNLSANALLDVANSLYGYEKFTEVVNKWKRG